MSANPTTLELLRTGIVLFFGPVIMFALVMIPAEEISIRRKEKKKNAERRKRK